MVSSSPAVPGRIRRVVTDRTGGVSMPPYDSFNLGDHVGDDPVAVADNRLRLADRIGLPAERLVWMTQVHGTAVATVDGPLTVPIPATDAVVTAAPDLALVVLTADCVPILLADETAGVLAAAHAGRLGARNGIVDRVLTAMTAIGADIRRVAALLGPAAGGECYEVPAEMRADVDRELPGSASSTAAGTPALDLRAGLRRQLLAAGVATVAQDPRCTIEDPALFSHRRGAPTGRLASVIWRDTRG